MIREARIHNQFASTTPPVEGNRMVPPEQAVPPSDLFVADGQAAEPALDQGWLSRDLRTPEGGIATAEAGNAVSGAVAGSALGPFGTSIAQTLSTVAPTLARALETAGLQVKEQGLDAEIQALEAELGLVAGTAGSAPSAPLAGTNPAPTTLELMWNNVRKLTDQVLAPENPPVAPEQGAVDLDAWARALDERQASLDRGDGAIEELVAQQCELQLAQKSDALQTQLSRQALDLDHRARGVARNEEDLQARQREDDDLVSSEVERLAGEHEATLLDSLRVVDGDLRALFETQQGELQQAHAAEEARLLDELKAHDAELQKTLAPGRARLNELYNQVQELQGYVTQWESAIANSRANTGSLNAQASGAPATDAAQRILASEVRSLQSEIRSLDNQVRNVNYQIQAEERKAKDIGAECDRIRRDLAMP